MKIQAVILATLAAAALLPAASHAQAIPYTVSQTGRGMIGINTDAVRGAQQPAWQRVITEVVEGSAAQRAGLAVGDTILRMNGLPATEQVIRAPLEPGDTVVLRVLRNGREREVTVVAGERPPAASAPQAWTYVLPDSAQRRVMTIMRSVQERMDTAFVWSRDSIRVQYARPGELPAGLVPDSILARIYQVAPGAQPYIFNDSARIRIVSPFTQADGSRIFSDTVSFLRPGEAMVSGLSIGMRSVAGAELAELNPGLAEYFGVMSGVLVLEAREGTPAASAGLRAGDVIIRANDTNIATVADLRRAVGTLAPGRAVQIRVLRHGQPVDLTLGR
jgi:C-terminal processing protease CtpA/Prc